MQTLQKINDEWRELISNRKQYDSIEFWNSKIKEMLKEIKTYSDEFYLDELIKDILGE